MCAREYSFVARQPRPITATLAFQWCSWGGGPRSSPSSARAPSRPSIVRLIHLVPSHPPPVIGGWAGPINHRANKSNMHGDLSINQAPSCSMRQERASSGRTRRHLNIERALDGGSDGGAGHCSTICPVHFCSQIRN